MHKDVDALPSGNGSGAIEFADVCFDIVDKRLVGPLRLTVRTGETLALVGASGSGKTTTLRLVNRLLDPTSGAVIVRGTPTTDWDPVELRRSIGYVIQDVGLFPHLTVSQNVGMVPRLIGLPGGEIDRRVHELLDMVDLPPDEFGSRRPHTLSGGQRQRVGVARALAADPDILLCDEPFGAVDPITRSELQREFKRLAEKLKKTVLFVTHDVREAVLLGHRIALFDHGRISFLGSSVEFTQSTAPAVTAFRNTVA